MKRSDCCLTVVFPRALEEEMVDTLLQHPEWISGFTIVQAEGTGQAVTMTGALEQVRGRARRVLIQTVIAHEDAQALIARLREALPHPEIAYWLMPVIEFGRLG